MNSLTLFHPNQTTLFICISVNHWRPQQIIMSSTLKDQAGGVCSCTRCSLLIRSLQECAKNNIKSCYQAKELSAKSSSAVSDNKQKRSKEESIRKIMSFYFNAFKKKKKIASNSFVLRFKYVFGPQILGPKWPNTTIWQNILQFTTVSKIYKDLPLFKNSSPSNSSLP